MLVSQGPMVRADWMEELSLQNPTTVEEWEAVLTAFKEKGVKIPWIGSAASLQNAFMPGFGLKSGWYRDGDEIKYGQAQPEYKEFLITMNDWYNKGLIDKNFAVTDSKTISAKILAGEAGALTGYAGSGMRTYLEANEGVDGFDLRGVQYPALKSGEKAEYSSLSRTPSMGNVTAISKNCKNVELAARFLDYGYTEEGNVVYNFGIEGESFNWVDKDGEKYPQFTDLMVNNPDGLFIANMISLYCRSGHTNVPMVQRPEYIQQYYQKQQQKDARIEWAKTNQAQHHLPQIYVANEVADEDADITAAVKTYIDEMTIKFISGREPIENFDKYLQQIADFGFEKSVSYRQDAYKRYQNR